MRVLVAVDDSPDPTRIMRYLAGTLAHHPDVRVTLFHVLRPMPRKLLEHGGSEDPVTEERLGDQLRKEQSRWSRQEQEAECRVLTTAREALDREGFPRDRVELKFGHEDDVARNILEEVQAGGYGTLVLGAGPASTPHATSGHVRNHIVHEMKHVAVWLIAP